MRLDANTPGIDIKEGAAESTIDLPVFTEETHPELSDMIRQAKSDAAAGLARILP